MTNEFASLGLDYRTPEFTEYMKEVFRSRNIGFKDPYEVARMFETQGWHVNYDFLKAVIEMQETAICVQEINAQ
jgi:hypothetical protein